MSTQVAITSPTVEDLVKRVTAASKHMVQPISSLMSSFEMRAESNLRLPTTSSEEKVDSIWKLLGELGIYEDEDSFDLLTSEDCKEGDFRAVFCDKYGIPVPRFKRMWKILTVPLVAVKHETREYDSCAQRAISGWLSEKELAAREDRCLQEEREKLEFQELSGKSSLDITRETLGVPKDEAREPLTFSEQKRGWSVGTNKIKEEVAKLAGPIQMVADKLEKVNVSPGDNSLTAAMLSRANSGKWKDEEIVVLTQEIASDLDQLKIRGSERELLAVKLLAERLANATTSTTNLEPEKDSTLSHIKDHLKLTQEDESAIPDSEAKLVDVDNFTKGTNAAEEAAIAAEKSSARVQHPWASPLQDFNEIPFDEETAKKVKNAASSMNDSIIDGLTAAAERDARDIAKYAHYLSWGAMSDEKLLTEYAQLTWMDDPASLFARKCKSIVAEIERRAGGTRPCILWNPDATVAVQMSVQALRDCRKKEHYSQISKFGWRRLRKAMDPVSTVYVFKSPVTLAKLNYNNPCEHFDDGKSTRTVDWRIWSARSLAMVWAIAREEDKNNVSTLTRMDRVFSVLQKFEKVEKDGFVQSLEMHPEYSRHLEALVDKKEEDDAMKAAIGNSVGFLEDDNLMNYVGEMHSRLRHNQIYEPQATQNGMNSPDDCNFSDPMEVCASSILAGKLGIVTEVDLKIPKIVKVVL